MRHSLAVPSRVVSSSYNGTSGARIQCLFSSSTTSTIQSSSMRLDIGVLDCVQLVLGEHGCDLFNGVCVPGGVRVAPGRLLVDPEQRLDPRDNVPGVVGSQFLGKCTWSCHAGPPCM